MVLERNMKHPNFITGAISYLLLLLGVVLNASGFNAGDYMIIISVVLGGIHWIKSIIDVYNDQNLKNEESSQYLWLSLVIMIPPVTGMLYYMMKRKKVSL